MTFLLWNHIREFIFQSVHVDKKQGGTSWVILTCHNQSVQLWARLGVWFMSIPGKEAPAIWVQEAEATEICVLVEDICGWQRCLPSQHKKCQEVKLLQIMDLDMEQKIWVGLFRWSRNTLSAKDLIKSAILLIYGFQTIPESFRRKHLPFHKASPKDRSG